MSGNISSNEIADLKESIISAFLTASGLSTTNKDHEDAVKKIETLGSDLTDAISKFVEVALAPPE